jgi:hypothetical protein
MLATPGLPAGSCIAPARTIRRKLTDGCSWCGTTSTGKPLGSVRSSYGGNGTRRAANGAGQPDRGHSCDQASGRLLESNTTTAATTAVNAP